MRGLRVLASLARYAELHRSQWLDPGALRRLQERKLARLVRHAAYHVPFYRERFRAAGIDPVQVRSIGDLARLPAVTKAELQAAGPDAIRSESAGTLEVHRSSGSTGRPFAVAMDARFLAVRHALFLRALVEAGYLPGSRALLIAEPGERASLSSLGLRRVSLLEPPARVLAALNEQRPRLLYGCMTALRSLARHIRDSGATAHRPHAVLSTAEGLDAPTRQLLAETLRAEVFDLYGSTELGLVGFECRAHAGLHIAEESAIVEREPGDGRLIVTNLELHAQPFIRFEVGDLGVRQTEPCRCGRSSARLLRIEGRLVDCIRLPGGVELSPYQVTCALEKVSGLERYQVLQVGPAQFRVRLEAPRAPYPATERAVESALRAALSLEHACIEVVREPRIEPVPGRKFRVVESRLGRGEAQ